MRRRLDLVATLLVLTPMAALAQVTAPGLVPALERLQLGEAEAAARALEPAARSNPQVALLLAALAGGGAPATLPAPQSPTDRLLWAEIWLAGRHPNEALGVLAPLLPDPPAALAKAVRRAAGRAAILAGRYEDAERYLAPVASGEAATSLVLARARYRRGDAAAAEQLLAPFAAALLAGGESSVPAAVAPELLCEQGRVLAASGRPAEAATALAKAVELAPSNGPAWQALAQARLAAGDRAGGEQAMARFRELARGNQPQPVDVAKLKAEAQAAEGQRIVDQALALARQGKEDAALADLRREITARPDLLAPRLLEISLLVARKNLAEAQHVADDTAANFPREPDAVYHRAIVAMMRGDKPLAKAALEHVLELAPEHVPALNNLAVLRLDRGDVAGGRALLEKVLTIDPTNAQALANLKKLPPAARP